MSKQKPEGLESNAEYQRLRSYSQDERNIIARDECAKRLHEQNVRDGKRSTFEKCQKELTEAWRKKGTIKDGG